jgi:hypothetical protein
LISGPTSYPLQLPEGIKEDDWFYKAFTYLNINLGGPFTDLVALWTELEEFHCWKTSGVKTLPPSKRPHELTRWVGSGRWRKGSIRIKIPSGQVEDFGDRVWIWWCELQPAWRTIESGKPGKRPARVSMFQDNWESLDIYGQNGWLGLLVCIKWWGETLLKVADKSQQKDKTEDWLAAIEDMSTMLRGLVQYHNKPKV